METRASQCYVFDSTFRKFLEKSVKHSLAVLGAAIRHRRYELGLSQEELAWRAGLNRTYVTDVERGARNLSLATIEKLADALGSPMSVLLHGVDKARGRVLGEGPGELAPQEILLVEDNSRDAELTLRALQRARLANSIHVARDGVEAVDYLFSTGRHAKRRFVVQPHLILLDLKLPRLSGLEVLRRITADDRTRSIPVVVLTVSEEGSDIAEALRLGAKAYIVKPVNFSRLNEATNGLELYWTLSRAPIGQRS